MAEMNVDKERAQMAEMNVDKRLEIISFLEEEKGSGLQAGGDTFKALCPFHEEKTPSFTLSFSKNVCYCFGCGYNASLDALLVALKKIGGPAHGK